MGVAMSNDVVHTMGMEATTNPTTTANPACTVCHGTGRDDVFGTDCTECWVDAQRNAIIQARYAGVTTTNADRAYTPGERMDGRTFGGNPNWRNDPATDKQLAAIARLGGTVTEGMTKGEASTMMDQLKATPDTPTNDRGNRTNRYPGTCVDCGQNVPAEGGLLFKVDGKWAAAHRPGECPEAPAEQPATEGLDLTGMVSGRYAVPGGDTRLKLQIDVVTSGKWEGWVFVKDAAEYGYGQRYGKQRPGQRYQGDVQDALAAILADPKAAAVAYGQLTGKCCVCNRTLEDENSVAAGIGPVCAQKF